MGKGGCEMVVYLDIAFLLNCVADAAALYVTAQVAGLRLPRTRLILAAALGGVYGIVCAFPPMEFAASLLPQLGAAAAMVFLAFGRQGAFLRQFLLFFLLSCTMGGALLAAGRLLRENGALKLLQTIDWKVFFLAGGICFLILSVVFRGEAEHAAAGRLYRGTVELRGRRAKLTVLLDTGHTLRDVLTGAPVLTVSRAALEGLWTPEERAVLDQLEAKGPAWCLERLGERRFRLLPYEAVGVSGGLLLCFRADRVSVDGRELGPMTVALSPTPVSGGGCTALWGGERGERCAA